MFIFSFFFEDPEGNTLSQARFILWRWDDKYKCNGFIRHHLCVFGTGDVPLLIMRKEMVSNKLMIEFDPISYMCMEEWHIKRIHSNDKQDLYGYCRYRNILAYARDKNCFLS